MCVKENTDCGATKRNSTMIISLLRRIFEADDRDVDGDDVETSRLTSVFRRNYLAKSSII